MILISSRQHGSRVCVLVQIPLDSPIARVIVGAIIRTFSVKVNKSSNWGAAADIITAGHEKVHKPACAHIVVCVRAA